MQEQIIGSYQERIDTYQKEATRYKQKANIVAFFRVFIFLAGITAGIPAWGYHPGLSAGIWVITIIILLILVKFSTALKDKIIFFKHLITINDNELLACKGIYNHFEDGNEFINKEHAYSFDLDIFGEGSIFQFLNRTCTLSGKRKLANYLSSPLQEADQIRANQEVILELSEKPDWRQKFQATGNRFAATEDAEASIRAWLDHPLQFLKKPGFKFLLVIASLLSFSSIALAIAGLVSFHIPLFVLLFNLVIVGFNLKKINAHHAYLSQKHKIINNYSNLLKYVGEEDFESEKAVQLQKKLKLGNEPASELLSHLGRIVNAFDNRLNILVSIALNALFLSDIYNVIRLEKWMFKCKAVVLKWFDVISEFDALSGFANMKYNHPSYIFPEVREKGALISMRQSGHILLGEEESVPNDFSIEHNGQFVIITGANMAGKSTFLRTTGVNLILAMTGAPVFASSFSFRPVELHTSMRTSDSIQKHESYFFAELKHLSRIIDAAKKKDNIFIILDEVLKGTNSRDKELGSKSLINRLINLNASGIIATHDLALGELEQKYTGKVFNKCFEVEINEDQLVFDYKLRNGVSKNMNATILMQKMGITEDAPSRLKIVKKD